ncbi:MAG: DUF2442 domain-containing protein [Ginsengibacter sp.]
MKIEKVWLDSEYVYIKTDIGHILGNPIVWFPRLLNATLEQRNNFEISPFGVHWPDVDEDLSLEGFFEYRREPAYEEHLENK